MSAQLKSMTGFGRAALTTKVGRFHVEIHTVNRRHLEMHFSLPRQLSRFEIEMRKWIEAKIGRGQVSVTLFWRNEESQAISIVPNVALAKAVKNAWEKIAEETGIQPVVTLSLLSHLKEILIFEEEIKDEEIYLESLQMLFSLALEEITTMREREGHTLVEDLKKRVEGMKESIEAIAQNSSHATEKYRDKLKKRLEELFSGHVENEEKILREVALFAEKIDITEEIVRFRSHLQQFQHLLTTPLDIKGEMRGKTLEFLVQELHREANTIGSKASDIAVIQYVVQLKSELEKVREQIQNIE